MLDFLMITGFVLFLIFIMSGYHRSKLVERREKEEE